MGGDSKFIACTAAIVGPICSAIGMYCATIDQRAIGTIAFGAALFAIGCVLAPVNEATDETDRIAHLTGELHRVRADRDAANDVAIGRLCEIEKIRKIIDGK
jgi:hypothetical protein